MYSSAGRSAAVIDHRGELLFVNKVLKRHLIGVAGRPAWMSLDDCGERVYKEDTAEASPLPAFWAA
jgi:hypothetical protein